MTLPFPPDTRNNTITSLLVLAFHHAVPTRMQFRSLQDQAKSRHFLSSVRRTYLNSLRVNRLQNWPLATIRHDPRSKADAHPPLKQDNNWVPSSFTTDQLPTTRHAIPEEPLA